jgi:VanZ family protein
MDLRSPQLARIGRIAFWLATLFAVTMAVLPKPPKLPMDRFGDKFEHMLAFSVLAFLAQFGFHRTPRLRIVERLSFLGAVIEVVQSIPGIHRDCDIKDWIADSVAILVVTLVCALIAGHWTRTEQ